MRHLARRFAATAATATLTTALLGLGAAPASAAACIPVSGTVGTVTYDICVTAEQLQPGYPGAGAYVDVSGYAEVCVGATCVRRNFGPGQTGAALNTEDSDYEISGSGVGIPNICVASACSPSTAPGVTLELFTDVRTATLRVAGIEIPINLPGVCVSTAGTCSTGGGLVGVTD